MARIDVGNESNRSISPQSLSDNSDQQQQQQHPQQPPFQTVYVGEVIFNTTTGEIIEANEEFKGKKDLTDKIYSIINALRMHMLMKQSNDAFKGVTSMFCFVWHYLWTNFLTIFVPNLVQFSDHYYKINMASDTTSVRKYLLIVTSVNV